MRETKKFIVDEKNGGTRLDLFLSGGTGKTRSSIGQLIASGHVTVNGARRKAGYRLKPGEVVTLDLPEEPPEDILTPEPIPLDILYRDDEIVIVNKPAGLVMYPAAGHPGGTLLNGLAHLVGRLAAVGGPLRPGVVHRLDRDTSGLVVVALTDPAYHDLVRQFRERTIEREYITIVSGDIRDDEGVIDLPIGRSRYERKKMSTRSRRGKEAKTFWKVKERFGPATLLQARLATGRTHQIRVHLAAMGHPVLGDRTYGRKTRIELKRRKIPVPRQMLHAGTLGITHPSTGERLLFRSPLPADMEEILTLLRRYFPESGRALR